MTYRILQVTDLHFMVDITQCFPEPDHQDLVKRWYEHLQKMANSENTNPRMLPIDTSLSESEVQAPTSEFVTTLCFGKTIHLFVRLLALEQPDLVIFSGDIFDGRQVKDEIEFEEKIVKRFFTLVKKLYKELVVNNGISKIEGEKDRKIKFLYIPGNHEGDFPWYGGERPRRTIAGRYSSGGEKLFNVIEKALKEADDNEGVIESPMFYSSDKASIENIIYFDRQENGPFNYGLLVNGESGSSASKSYIVVFCFDSGTGMPPYIFREGTTVISEAQQWLNKLEQEEKVNIIQKICYVHQGVWGIHNYISKNCPAASTDSKTDTSENTGISVISLQGKPSTLNQNNHIDSNYEAKLAEFLIKNNIHVFSGHDHHSDGVAVVSGAKNDVSTADSSNKFFAGFGRAGSYFPPSEHELNLMMEFPRGGRIVDVELDSSKISTWIRDQNGEKTNEISI